MELPVAVKWSTEAVTLPFAPTVDLERTGRHRERFAVADDGCAGHVLADDRCRSGRERRCRDCRADENEHEQEKQQTT
jgi:hypothetical protein